MDTPYIEDHEYLACLWVGHLCGKLNESFFNLMTIMTSLIESGMQILWLE